MAKKSCLCIIFILLNLNILAQITNIEIITIQAKTLNSIIKQQLNFFKVDYFVINLDSMYFN